MKLLSLETSTKNFSLAVSRGDKILSYRNVLLNKVLSSSIIPGISRILDKSGIPLKQLDGFAVGLGPGSFTSLRVGLATVKGFAFAVQKPIVGIPSLDILARNVNGKDISQICTLCDAKRNLVFGSIYKKSGNTIERKSPYLLTSIEELLAKIQGKTIFVGDGIKLYRDVIIKESRLKSNKARRDKTSFDPVFADEDTWFPQARALAGLALERFHQKKFDNSDKLVPLYLYPEDCQVRKHKAEGRSRCR